MQKNEHEHSLVGGSAVCPSIRSIHMYGYVVLYFCAVYNSIVKRSYADHM